jgi:hypothetical protein
MVRGDSVMELFDFGEEKIGEYQVIVIGDSGVDDVQYAVEEWGYQEYYKAFGKFKQLSAIYDWVELRDLNNKHDTLLECSGSNFE